MKLACATIDGDVIQIEVEEDSTFEDVKTILSVELDVDIRRIKLAFSGDDSIPDTAKLSDVGVQDNDMLAVTIAGANLEDTSRRASLRNSLSRVSEDELLQQQLIEREIAIKNIEENLEKAFNEAPEAFATVLMLYVDVNVNGVPVKAFVDSGAQTTVMSRKCAERCGILRLVDTRFAGVAVGVGQARILGRVHLAPIQMGSYEYNCSFTVLDGDMNMDLLLGLDLLKKHHMVIDLKNDCLHVGDADELIPFLGESEVPVHARLH